ncbi:hypothetical protein A3C87_02230 [Candidatus Kaiserbacteria bacterium RIFCSPHIGHO2_02_FULL_49_34]|uniref:RNA-binding S4 domain-containing protein n=1 Tax=Candidatus Kaiserbacteria bacterium RIFCSPHIGHO2_02_FULL_49_34 TaxID=1798491 RepID=A0A1F6DKX7_9BACT|nr:MAG: hypothetical protein A3C87_02230 [Candidatus Kaiserbacteria bacterium RIFCSPHIGHO2_02_FULL_49_34]
MEFPLRINKYLAETGISTRRGADALIAKGVVFVNGKKATVGQIIAKTDKVEVRTGKNVVPTEYTYIAYHKPAGELTFGGSEETERDLLMRLEKEYNVTGLTPVGRLERANAGLILLTNDGRVTRKLFAADAQFDREYLVTVDKRMFGAVYAQLERGMTIERAKTKPAKVERIDSKTFRLTIQEGKKHQVKRMLAACGYQIMKLVRLRVATVSIGKMKPGQFRVLKGAELTEFLEALDIK